MAWTPAGHEIWFSARQQDAPSGGLELHAVTVSGRRRVVSRVPGPNIIQQIWRDGRVLLKADDFLLNMMCRSAGDTTERDLSWLGFYMPRDMSDDGRFVVFGEVGSATGSKAGVYLRTLDGAAAVRLGDGMPLALSPDGQSVLAIEAGAERIIILRTGSGERRELTGDGVAYTSAAWIPGAARILVGGHKPGSQPALYVQDIAGGAPRPVVTGVDRGIVSPDGSTVATIDPQGVVTLTPIGSGSSRTVHGLPPSSRLLRWSKSGTELFARVGTVPLEILRLNVETQRAAPWRTLEPVDREGGVDILNVAVSADGHSYCYSYLRNLSALYVVTGLK